MVTHIARVWINRVRLPILHVVSWTRKIFPCPRSRLRIWSRETGSAAPSRVSLLISILRAESGAYSLRDSSRVPRRRPFIYYLKPPYAIGSVLSLSGNAITYRWRSLPRVRRHRASKPQGSSEQVLPWQVTMDQLICASLSHTHSSSIGSVHYKTVVVVVVVFFTLLLTDRASTIPSNNIRGCQSSTYHNNNSIW